MDFSEISGGKFDITIDPVSSLWDFKADSPAPPSDKEIKAALEHVGYGNIELNGTSIKLSDPNSALDLGGIAKGFIGDKAKEFLLENGVKEAMISLGGNILIICPENRDFKIGVQKPFGMDGQLIGAIVTSGNSIVTSGIYQRYFEYNGKLYHHILDTSTGYPVDNGLASVTITGPSSAVCDALSTTVFCLGADDGLDLINSIDGYEAIIITKENKTVYSDGINKSVTFLTNS